MVETNDYTEMISWLANWWPVMVSQTALLWFILDPP